MQHPTVTWGCGGPGTETAIDAVYTAIGSATRRDSRRSMPLTVARIAMNVPAQSVFVEDLQDDLRDDRLFRRRLGS